MFVDAVTLARAVGDLRSTAHHFLKIWLVLKAMGLSESHAVDVNTGNSTSALQRLFSCGDPAERFFVPFASTPRYLVMKNDASRSIIQTTLQRWSTSASVVTCDPTGYLDFESLPGGSVRVTTGRRYPLGLGHGHDGFAPEGDSRAAVPIWAFAVWYGRQSATPDKLPALDFLVSRLLADLEITPSERALIFDDSSPEVAPTFGKTVLSDAEVFDVCSRHIEGKVEPTALIEGETRADYARRVRRMTSNLELPSWMRSSPESEVHAVLARGETAILLYGPPRTGKTRIIDEIVARNDPSRETIQIHDGWGYDYLVQGFRPDEHGNWDWRDGPLKQAIEAGKKWIVLEEVNRTSFSQALGEVFSLIEIAYRGKAQGVQLRSGATLWIPEDTVFFMTMNTVDRSTEDVDDALMGRVAAVEFPPRPESLTEMLDGLNVGGVVKIAIQDIYAEILAVYPLGHGYFVGIRSSDSLSDVIAYYKSRVRPVLRVALGDLHPDRLANIDAVVDSRAASGPIA